MKQPTIAARIQTLRAMTVPDLVVEHARVFGEEPRSTNKGHLWRKLAWQLQANEEGGLADDLRQQLAEIASRADPGAIFSRSSCAKGDQGATARTEVVPFGRRHDPRLPIPGTIITREYRGSTLRVTVLDRGFEHDGIAYASLSALANAITGTHMSGMAFFGLARKASTRATVAKR